MKGDPLAMEKPLIRHQPHADTPKCNKLVPFNFIIELQWYNHINFQMHSLSVTSDKHFFLSWEANIFIYLFEKYSLVI